MSTQIKKSFDCVAMKRDIQRRLLDEYEASRDQYDSYWHFLQETNRDNPSLQGLRQKLGFSSPSDDSHSTGG